MRIRVGPETDFAGAIYGQVLGGGAVVALSRHDETPIQIATAVSRALPTPRAGWPSASGHLEARRRRHRAGRVRHGGSIPATIRSC